MSNLGCADEEAGEGRSDRERSSIPSADTEAGHPKGVRSVARKRSSSSIDYFCLPFAGFDLNFCFYKSGS